MIRTALIFAPHQDDELNIAGSLMEQMILAGIKISVCFLTNGDWKGEQEKRLKEAKNVATIFGYNDIIYLGYGDGGFTKSLYYAPNDDTVVFSPAGFKETYGVGDKQDFHYIKYGEHADYTKRNVRNDIRDVIQSVKADIIFCVDSDEHPDHKLLSEQFDKAILEIVSKSNYHPIVLKTFAYLGVFYGANDYFIRPMQQTKCESYGRWARSDCAPYNWEERISFAVSNSVYPLCWWKSKLFKALKVYKSQRGVKFFPRICNADAVYWFYDTKLGDYTLSSDFPLEQTPFRYYKTIYKNITNHNMLKLIYEFYYDKLPEKINRIIKKILLIIPKP